MIKNRGLVLGLMITLVIGVVGVSFAEINPDTYPDKPIKEILAYSPGGGSDTLAQAINPYLQKYLDQTTVVEYHPGASGAVGYTYAVQNTPADGYHIVLTCTPPIFANPIMKPEEIKYTMDDYVPLYNVVDDPGVFVVPENSKFNSMEEIIEYAKDNPGSVTVGHSGVGGDDWYTVLLLNKIAGIELVPVPFTGDGPSMQAALGGHIDISKNNISIVYSQIKDGALKALAVTAEERFPDLPDVPTMQELGYKIFTSSARGFSVLKGTPQVAFDILEKAFEKAVNDPEFRAYAKKTGLPIRGLNGKEYAEYLEQQAEDFKGVWEDYKGQEQ